jgi:hypothetical protein
VLAISHAVLLPVVTGGPTLITDQTIQNSRASKGWLALPRTNRLVCFDGRLLHCVLPGAGASPAPNARRTTFMAAFWEGVLIRHPEGVVHNHRHHHHHPPPPPPPPPHHHHVGSTPAAVPAECRVLIPSDQIVHAHTHTRARAEDPQRPRFDEVAAAPSQCNIGKSKGRRTGRRNAAARVVRTFFNRQPASGGNDCFRKPNWLALSCTELIRCRLTPITCDGRARWHGCNGQKASIGPTTRLGWRMGAAAALLLPSLAAPPAVVCYLWVPPTSGKPSNRHQRRLHTSHLGGAARSASQHLQCVRSDHQRQCLSLSQGVPAARCHVVVAQRACGLLIFAWLGQAGPSTASCAAELDLMGSSGAAGGLFTLAEGLLGLGMRAEAATTAYD